MQGIRLAGLFQAGGTGYYLLVLVFMALLVALYIWGSNRRSKASRAEELEARYIAGQPLAVRLPGQTAAFPRPLPGIQILADLP